MFTLYFTNEDDKIYRDFGPYKYWYTNSNSYRISRKE